MCHARALPKLANVINKRLIDRVGLAAIALFIAASPAHAAESVSMPIALALGGGLAAAIVGLVYLYYLLRASRDAAVHSAEAASRLMDRAPAGLVRWGDGGASFSTRAVELLELSRNPGLVGAKEADDIICGAVSEPETARLSAAIQTLHADGTGFEDRWRISNETSVTLCGERLEETDLVWVLDAKLKPGLPMDV